MSYDWNHNGEHDTFDDYMEYEIYKDVMNSGHSSSSSNAGFLTILSIVIGFGVVAVIFNMLSVEVEDVPTFILILIVVPVVSFVAALLSS